jgi:PAS domain S-box-containing protein
MANQSSDGHRPGSIGGAGTDSAVPADEFSGTAPFLLDSNGVITAWTEPARGLYGYEGAEVVGQELDVLFANGEEIDDELADFLDRPTDSSFERAYHHRRADGSEFPAGVVLMAPWRDRGPGFAAITQELSGDDEYREALERQNDRLKKFTDILAHDLRNPLTVIDSRLDLYRQTGEGKHLDAIEETTGRMAELLDDLLQVAQHGNAVTDPDRVDMRSVVDTAWESTGGQSPAATLQYESISEVSGDRSRLCQLFENLFRNALEHVEGDVTLRVGPLEDGFYVEDDGPGIPSELRDKAFEHGVTTTDGGTGYGLSIVRTITDAHGWRISLAEGDGGASFEITGVEFAEL